MIGADAKLRPAEGFDEVSQSRYIIDERVIVKASRLLDRRTSTQGYAKVVPTEHQARQRECETAAAMADGDPEPTVPLQNAVGDQRGDGKRGLAGKRHELNQRRRPYQSVETGWMKGMNQDGSAQRLGRRLERQKAAVTEHDAVDVCADLDASE